MLHTGNQVLDEWHGNGGRLVDDYQLGLTQLGRFVWRNILQKYNQI